MRAEDALQSAVCTYLDNCLPRAAWYCAIPNGAVLAGSAEQRARQMNRLKRTGLRPGAPDLIVLHDGMLLAIELKAGRGVVSKTQEATCQRILGAGGAWTVARSIEDVASFLIAHGVPMIGMLAA